MKKVISVATTAAMTLSMLAVPAVVCAADLDGAVQKAAFVVEDAQITKGKTTTFEVPVRATRTGHITEESTLDLSAAMYYGGIYTASVKDVKTDVEGLEATVSGSTVTVSGTGSVTKGDVVATIMVELSAETPQNALFELTVDKATGDFAELEKTSAYLFVVNDTTTEGASFVLEAENTFVKETELEIPVKISGTYGSLVAKFGASNGAVVTGIKIASEYEGILKPTDDKTGVAYLPQNTDSEELSFNDTTIATITVKLPEDAVSGQSFKIATRYFDGSNSEVKTVTPATMEDADVIFVMKGDANLDNTVTQPDSVVLLKEVLARDAKRTYFRETWAEDGIDQTDEVNYTIKTLGIDALEDAAYAALDTDVAEEVKVDASDCAVLLRYILERDARVSKGTIEGEADFLYSDYLAELAK